MNRGLVLVLLGLGAILTIVLALSYSRHARKQGQPTQQHSGRPAEIPAAHAAPGASDTKRRNDHARNGAEVEPGRADSIDRIESDSQGDGGKARGSVATPVARMEPDGARGPEVVTDRLRAETPSSVLGEKDRAPASETSPPTAGRDSGRTPWSGGSVEILAPISNPDAEAEQDEPVGEPEPSSKEHGGDGTAPPGPASPSTDVAAAGEPHIGIVSLATFPGEIGVGDQVIVEVRIADASGIRGVPFHLIYPADLLEYESGEVGSFLESSTQEVVFAADGPPGRLIVALTQFGEGPGASGTGTLCQLRFRAKSPGLARLSFEDSHLFAADRTEIDCEYRPVVLSIR